MRAIGISLLSVALTTTVIANAYYQKKQFYPSVVYITKSNPSMAVSSNSVHFIIPYLHPPCILGNVHSSLHCCISNGKVNAKDILWAVANCRI